MKRKRVGVCFKRHLFLATGCKTQIPLGPSSVLSLLFPVVAEISLHELLREIHRIVLIAAVLDLILIPISTLIVISPFLTSVLASPQPNTVDISLARNITSMPSPALVISRVLRLTTTIDKVLQIDLCIPTVCFGRSSVPMNVAQMRYSFLPKSTVRPPCPRCSSYPSITTWN